jgi:hypothetical protein
MSSYIYTILQSTYNLTYYIYPIFTPNIIYDKPEIELISNDICSEKPATKEIIKNNSIKMYNNYRLQLPTVCDMCFATVKILIIHLPIVLLTNSGYLYILYKVYSSNFISLETLIMKFGITFVNIFISIFAYQYLHLQINI